MARYRTWVNDTTPAINADNLNAVEDRLRYISVKDKSLSGGGAVGDNTNDDTTSIQAAINLAVATSPVASVYLPAGNYKITSALTIPVSSFGFSLVGEGRESTFIRQFTNNTPVVQFADGFTHTVTIRDLHLTYNTQQTGSHPNSNALYHPDTDTFGHLIDRVRVSYAYNGIGLQQGATNTMWGTTLRNISIQNCANSAIVWKSAVANGMPGNMIDHAYITNLGTTNTGPCIDLNIQPCFLARCLDIEDWKNTAIRMDGDVTMPPIFDGVYFERHTVTAGASRILFEVGAGGIFRSVAIDVTGDVGAGNTLTLWRTEWPYAHLSVEGCGFNQLSVTNGTIHVYDYTHDYSDPEDGADGARAYFRGMAGMPAAVVGPHESGATLKARNTLKEWNGELYNTRLGGVGTGAIQFQEVSEPAAPAANKVRLFAKDNGAGKTQLMAKFPTGAAQQVAIEP